MLLQVVVLVGAFMTAICLCIALFQIIFASRLTVLDRLDMQTKGPQEQYETAAAKNRSMRANLLILLGNLGRLFPRRTYFERMQKQLVQAHIFLRAEEFLGLCLMSSLAAFLLIFLLMGNVLPALLLAVIAYMLPGFYVKTKKKKRSKNLNIQLPEALGIIANGLRAGYSFPQAMDVVSREMVPPISEEFGRIIRENRLGKPMEEVLREFSERADDEDIDIFITALIIQKQVGGNLAEVLNKIEHTIRERVRIKGEISTLTAQQKLSGVILVLLPIAVAFIMFLISPDYISLLFQEIIGWIMVGIAIVLMIIGIIIITKIVNIEV